MDFQKYSIEEKKKKKKKKVTKIIKKIYIKEKAMATHSSTLAWKIPWTEEPSRLQFMGSLGVGHD